MLRLAFAEMAAENGSSEQAAPAKKSSSKKSKKDKTAASVCHELCNTGIFVSNRN